MHAQNDITDEGGYTTYVEKYGVTKLPTLVLFRQGEPQMFPYDRPIEKAAVVAW